MAHRRHAGAHPDRQVAEDEADDQDDRRAGDLYRGNIVSQDIGNTDDRAGHAEGQHQSKFQHRFALELLARQHPGSEQADGCGDRRGDGGELNRREERAPGTAGPEDAVRRPFERKARPKCDSVGVQSRPQTLTKPPASAST